MYVFTFAWAIINQTVYFDTITSMNVNSGYKENKTRLQCKLNGTDSMETSANISNYINWKAYSLFIVRKIYITTVHLIT